MKPMRLEFVLRALALLIVVLAFADPSFVSERRVRPVVSIVTSDSSSLAAQQLRAQLYDKYDAVFASVPADAAIVLDESLVSSVPATAPVVVVNTTKDVRITGVDYPSHVLLNEPAALSVSVESASPRDSIVLELRKGSVVMAAATVSHVYNDSSFFLHTFALPLVTAGNEKLTIVASGSDGSDIDTVSIGVQVKEKKYRVHFHDVRASWMSTFVRRNAELDNRFIVSSRTATSRGVRSVSGNAPTEALTVSALSSVDLLVVGAPERLSRADVSGIEAYLKEHGGSVLLLFDSKSQGYTESLTAVKEWRTGSVVNAFPVIAGAVDAPFHNDSAAIPSLRVSEWMAPVAVPAGATVLAHSVGTDTLPLLYNVPVGIGRVWVSGALDAWRYRDSNDSQFAATWNAVLADAASLAVPAIEVRLSPSLAYPAKRPTVVAGNTSILRPSTSYTVNVVVRDVFSALSGSRAVPENVEVKASAILRSVEDSTMTRGREVHLFPLSQPGLLGGEFVSPEQPGRYRLEVRVSALGGTFADTQEVDVVSGHGGATTGTVAVGRTLLSGGAQPVSTSANLLGGLRALSEATGGGQLVATATAASRSLDTLLDAPTARVQWHPMRSPWWILPLTVLLGAEWWLRRRSGKP